MKKIKLRKNLCADALIARVAKNFKKIPDHRAKEPQIKLTDGLMSAYAMFSIKSSSMLQFMENAKKKNLHNIFLIEKVPSDTHMRVMLDDIDPDSLRPAFTDIFRQIQRGKNLEQMVFFNGCYLVSLDGTGYFFSDKINCANCLVKSSKTGQAKYYHQMLGAAIVHPDRREVIPFYPEAIIKQDGDNKNDCERNAAKRFLKKFRQDHPYLPVIIIEDALSANAPHIDQLRRYNCHYILGVKPGDHKYLFEHLETEFKKGNATTHECVLQDQNGKQTAHKFCFINQAPINESNQKCLVNFIEYWEIQPDGSKRYFSWITDFEVTTENVFQLMRGGRARWKIENETFNTLKNQGYNFEHNYGHGNKNLSTVLAALMMLAFLTDQVQQLACELFNAAWQKLRAKKYLWEKIKILFQSFIFDSMEHLLKIIVYGVKNERLSVAGFD